jgi:spore coat protein CotH
MEFSELCSQNDVALFRSKVGTYLDVEQFLRFIAVNAFTSNWDSYLGGGHNFYLYLDPKDDKFRFIPWDLDLSMQAAAAAVPVFRVVQPNGAGVAGSTVVMNGNTFVIGAPAPGAPPTAATAGAGHPEPGERESAPDLLGCSTIPWWPRVIARSSGNCQRQRSRQPS